VELPDPVAPDDLVAYLEDASKAAHDWHEISSALLAREREKNDIQAGWLMTAFDYHLARRVGEERDRLDGFGSQLEGGGMKYPTPIDLVPDQVIELWASATDRLAAPGPRARLHHLLFQRGYGNRGAHGRAAAAAYLELGTGSWDRLERANCLHWAVDLYKRVGDRAEAARVYPVLVALATESMDQEQKEPGVALHVLEVLAFEDPNNSDLPALLERARQVYGDDPFLTKHTIRIQEQIFRSDPEKRNQLRRDAVEAYITHAMKFPKGLMRMSFLEDAVKMANQYEVSDLADSATQALQEISMDDLDLKRISATASVSAAQLDAVVAELLNHDTLKEVLEGLALGGPPTGNYQVNLEWTKQIARDAPLTTLFPTRHLGQDGLTRYTAISEEDRLDEQLAMAETTKLGVAGEVVARVFEGALTKFDPSAGEIAAALSGLSHVSDSVARSIARALLFFGRQEFEHGATTAMPRVETLVRDLCDGKGILRYRVQRDQRGGQSVRGQYPQLGALLGQAKPWMDRSWWRYFWTFLVSPFGPNYRNELLHGYVDEVSRTNAALTILAAVRLSLVPLNDEAESDEGEEEGVEQEKE
jgi:hypothetical protein